MNQLPTGIRAQALNMLVEGSSMRSVSRVLGIAMGTVTKLLVDAGGACLNFHDRSVRGVSPRYVQCDEMWSFCYAKERNALEAGSGEAGNVWTWTAIDSDTKLLVSWLVGDRGAGCAADFMVDLRSRTVGRYQLSTDGHPAYVDAVRLAFGREVDYAQVVKGFRSNAPVTQRVAIVIGDPDRGIVSAFAVERHNLTMRMSMKRYARRSNAFSKKTRNLTHAAALYAVWYNWVRPHTSLDGRTPAQAAGLAEYPQSLRWILSLLD